MLVLVPTTREFEALFGHTLDDWSNPGKTTFHGHELDVALCGFGLAAAGTVTSKLIAQTRCTEILVCGIAGTYNPNLIPIGNLLCATRVWSFGIGAQSADRFEQPSDMGIPQSVGETARETIFELLELTPCRHPESAITGGLVSVAFASSGQGSESKATEVCPGALAEDMESFAVALACHIHKIPLTVLRGISNIVGERDPMKWRFQDAIESVRDGLLDLLEGRAQVAH